VATAPDTVDVALSPMLDASVVVGPASSRFRPRLPAAVRALRPPEWVKNAFVMVPLVFSGRLGDAEAFAHAVAATVAFCAVASAGYLFNDIRDVELDREHPQKCRRPIAAGDLRVGTAMVLAVGLAVAGPVVAAYAGLEVLAVIVLYAVLTAAYSSFLKTLVIIDVMTIAAGFLLRVQAGLAAVDGRESQWLLLCTGMVAMLLGFTKRRQEAVSELHDGLRTRPVLEHYSLPFLDQMVSLTAGGSVLAYVLYTADSPLIGDRMMPTAIPVVYGVLRYLYLIYHQRDQRSMSTVLVTDPGIIGAGAVWIVLAAILLYA
jgi:4-hydroxybenzoate polyprenyltransferase